MGLLDQRAAWERCIICIAQARLLYTRLAADIAEVTPEMALALMASIWANFRSVETYASELPPSWGDARRLLRRACKRMARVVESPAQANPGVLVCCGKQIDQAQRLAAAHFVRAGGDAWDLPSLDTIQLETSI